MRFQVTARQESVFQWILALGLELRSNARSSRGNADSDRIGWTRTGREEMEDQVDPSNR